jgi:hypothetical protein
VSTSSSISWFIVFVLAYLEGPIILVWGWLRWSSRRPRLWTISSTLSLIGLALSSASAFLGLWTIGYACSGGFELKYDFFFRVVTKGFILSLGAMLFALGGIWRKSSLRWFAPSSSLGVFAFWLVATTWP